MSEELEIIDDWTRDRVNHLTECVKKLDKSLVAIQMENFKGQIECFKTDVAKSLQEHVNQIEDTKAEATLLDQEVQDLHNKTVINIGIKK